MDDSELPTFTPTPSATTDANRDVPDVYDPAPRYQGDDIWSHWEMVDRANKAVTESQVLLAELESKLKTKTEEGAKLKERSSMLFENVHRKPRLRLPPSLQRLQPNSASSVAEDKDSARQEFEIAHKDETALMSQIEDLTVKVESLRENIENNMGLASTVDQVFELLGASVAATLPDYEAYTAAEESLGIASTQYDQTQKLVSDFTRARVTVQHAHHYYTVVLQTIDSVRGTVLGRVLLGGLGEISKQQDYKVAVQTAAKAQICFNETVRVLTPHSSAISPTILHDFDTLKEMGLLQASKIYGLMYGWKSRTSGINKSVELMLQRQEDMFSKLTRLAVWIQDTVPVYEAQLRASRANRDQMRRDLVYHWSRHRREILDITSRI